MKGWIVGLLLAVPGLAVGQACKYQVNKTDPFTKKKLIQTETVDVAKNMGGSWSISGLVEDTTVSLRFVYIRSDQPFKMEKGSAMYLLLANDSVVVLHAKSDVDSKVYTLSGYTSHYLFDDYPITKSQIQLLASAPLKGMKLDRPMGQEQQFIENNKRALKFQQVIKCLMAATPNQTGAAASGSR